MTSQLFSNVYLDIFDQYVKRVLRVKYYMRYADDFVVLDNKNETLEEIFPKLQGFLEKELLLTIHPDKIVLRKYNQGIDFLGYVIFPFHKVLRTKTKRRILRKVAKLKEAHVKGQISDDVFIQTVASYRGLLMHCQGKRISKTIREIVNKNGGLQC